MELLDLIFTRESLDSFKGAYYRVMLENTTFVYNGRIYDKLSAMEIILYFEKELRRKEIAEAMFVNAS